MKKIIRIGLMGTPINNINLGCVALTYSTIYILEKLRKKNNYSFQYVIFDYKYDESRFDEMCDTLNINRKTVEFCPFALLSDPLRIIKYFPRVISMIRGISKCDLILDLTEGDSFSDIYGDVVFKGRTTIKSLIEKKDIPLILGPQTYGPFTESKNEKFAFDVIKKANVVISRDNVSTEYLRKCGREQIETTIDNAFILPFEKIVNNPISKIKVGLNISSMLYSEKLEMKEQRFELKTDYKLCIDQLVEWLIDSKIYEVYLIPHVELDDNANQQIMSKFKDVNYIKPQTNPSKVKAIINSMDVFLGARMHATIAAVSSGVACIPMGYSRKFSGLYESIGYSHVVDLQKCNTEESLNMIISKIRNFENIREDARKTKAEYSKLIDKTIEIIDEAVKQIMDRMC